MKQSNTESAIQNILQRDQIILDLGCGASKTPGAIGVDRLPSPGVDLLGDIYDVLSEFPDRSVDLIYAHHFCEHLEELETFLKEVSRVLKAGGSVSIVVPHFSNPFFYSDPTHKTFFGLYTFSYFCRSSLFRRSVPSYCRIDSLELTDVKLGFKSFPPRYLTHAARLLLRAVFNSSNYMKEVYEDSFSNIFSCYELRFMLTRV